MSNVPCGKVLGHGEYCVDEYLCDSCAEILKLRRRQGGGKGPRYGKRVDANQKYIVATLEAIGCDVLEIGWPLDLLVGYRGRNFLLEVKDPDQDRTHRQLTKDEAEFVERWRGQQAVVETPGEAVEVVTERKL